MTREAIGGVASLTPSQRRLADLAAQGLTNPADRPRTVRHPQPGGEPPSCCVHQLGTRTPVGASGGFDRPTRRGSTGPLWPVLDPTTPGPGAVGRNGDLGLGAVSTIRGMCGRSRSGAAPALSRQTMGDSCPDWPGRPRSQGASSTPGVPYPRRGVCW
jgi:hypothetical protein